MTVQSQLKHRPQERLAPAGRGVGVRGEGRAHRHPSFSAPFLSLLRSWYALALLSLLGGVFLLAVALWALYVPPVTGTDVEDRTWSADQLTVAVGKAVPVDQGIKLTLNSKGLAAVKLPARDRVRKGSSVPQSAHRRQSPGCLLSPAVDAEPSPQAPESLPAPDWRRSLGMDIPAACAELARNPRSRRHRAARKAGRDARAPGGHPGGAVPMGPGQGRLHAMDQFPRVAAIFDQCVLGSSGAGPFAFSSAHDCRASGPVSPCLHHRLACSSQQACASTGAFRPPWPSSVGWLWTCHGKVSFRRSFRRRGSDFAGRTADQKHLAAPDQRSVCLRGASEACHA